MCLACSVSSTVQMLMLWMIRCENGASPLDLTHIPVKSLGYNLPRKGQWEHRFKSMKTSWWREDAFGEFSLSTAFSQSVRENWNHSCGERGIIFWLLLSALTTISAHLLLCRCTDWMESGEVGRHQPDSSCELLKQPVRLSYWPQREMEPPPAKCCVSGSRQGKSSALTSSSWLLVHSTGAVVALNSLNILERL